jgi:hypothetical protein
VGTTVSVKPARTGVTRGLSGGAHGFDLNIQRVLEHWTIPFAIREVIANALDEQILTQTADPLIAEDTAGRWHIRDFGRGLRYEHLTQNESLEKRRDPRVVGQFGMGLKDALAVFDRRGIELEILSPHGDIRTARMAKAGFADVVTLHAIVGPPADFSQPGTDVVLSGVTAEQIETAKSLFLRFSGDTALEATRYGQVLSRPSGSEAARVYVKGLLVAREENFLFSYNITDINAPLRKALNRERSNVGRSAYTDRVKKILIECSGAAVAGQLTRDLAAFSTGRQHDELRWRDVALHACRVLQTHEKVVFVTAAQLHDASPQLRYAEDDGYRLVTVPDDIAAALRRLTDLDGRPMMDLGAYRQAWNDSFQYSFVDPEDLTESERAVFARAGDVAQFAGISIGQGRIRHLLVSQTMRMSPRGDMVLGMWDPAGQRIIIRRDQLRTLAAFAGTLLHELGHATSGTTDGTMEFEDELTRLLGQIASPRLSAD